MSSGRGGGVQDPMPSDTILCCVAGIWTGRQPCAIPASAVSACKEARYKPQSRLTKSEGDPPCRGEVWRAAPVDSLPPDAADAPHLYHPGLLCAQRTAA